jgi:uncharacterized protein YcfJ
VNRSNVIAAVVGAAAVTAVGAVAGYKAINADRYAEVISAKPVTTTVRTPRQECHDEAVTRQAPTKDPNQIAGTVAGAVVGGVVGNQFGGGKGKTAATVAGAVGGGYAGNKIQERMQEGNTYTTTESRCQTVTDSSQKVVGYDVRYRLNGKEDVVRMDHDPGSRIEVRDGALVVEPRKS